MRESTAKLRLISVALTASSVLLVLLTVILSVRLLIIQSLNILIIIIIISFLALRLETSYRHALQPTVLTIISVRAWTWCSINIVICT